MYQSLDFMVGPYFTDAFVRVEFDISNMFLTSISNANISHFGEIKISQLLRLLVSIKNFILEEKIETKNIRVMLDTFKTKETNHDYPVEMILCFLADHEDSFGIINFEDYDNELEEWQKN